MSIINKKQFEITNEDIRKKEAEIKENNKSLTACKNKDYILQKELVKLQMEECKLKIGKCYVKENTVYRIIEIDDIRFHMDKPPSFNEYVYKTISFEYPFDNSLNPFKNREINLCPGFITRYKEISKEEFNKKFIEVNEAWKKLLI